MSKKKKKKKPKIRNAFVVAMMKRTKGGLHKDKRDKRKNKKEDIQKNMDEQ